jgi:septal ring factor EnvC (AmiA/AmiB activator)
MEAVPAALTQALAEGDIAASSPARQPLALPVDGTLVERFGDPERGLRSRGVAFRVDATGPVLAPCAGRVMFARSFRSLGLLLIIRHADGYHTLLAGMSRLDVRVGQVVGRGQPVGLMTVDGGGNNRLYMELRRSGEPIDPMPSLAARDGKVRG